VGPEANAQNLNPAGGSQAGLCKKLFRRNKKNSINTKPATQPPSFIYFFYPAQLGAICLFPAVHSAHRHGPPLPSLMNQAKENHLNFSAFTVFR